MQYRYTPIVFAFTLLAGCAGHSKSNAPDQPLTPREQQARDISALQQSVSANPSNPATHFALGNALFDAQRYAEAKNAYQEAILIRPDYAAAYCNMGLCLRVLGQHEEALDAYHRALELEPNDQTTLANFIAGLRAIGDGDASVAALQKLLSLRPDDALLQSELANLHFRQKNYAAAAIAFQEVIRLDPGMSSDYYNLGLCQMELNELDTALTTWLTAIAYDASNTSVRKGLAVLYWRRGEFDKAWQAVVDCQTRAISLDSDFLASLRRDSGQTGPES
ncbi:MAG: tetratricopeptide repeat protein [Candidatus Hydrogenedentes bacterium]|nr:tetratricopeptide repeat protein [Candidatus Hydrogenedentota bacterium]